MFNEQMLKSFQQDNAKRCVIVFRTCKACEVSCKRAASGHHQVTVSTAFRSDCGYMSDARHQPLTIPASYKPTLIISAFTLKSQPPSLFVRSTLIIRPIGPHPRAETPRAPRAADYHSRRSLRTAAPWALPTGFSPNRAFLIMSAPSILCMDRGVSLWLAVAVAHSLTGPSVGARTLPRASVGEDSSTHCWWRWWRWRSTSSSRWTVRSAPRSAHCSRCA